jgi:long-chain acyl-CoA synthetase
MNPIAASGSRAPDAAVITTDGSRLTHADLELRSTRLAAAFEMIGLAVGDHIAVMMPNELEYFVVAWAAHRSGLYWTPINWHLTADEAAYVVDDCTATVFISSPDLAAIAADVGSKLQRPVRCLSSGERFGEFEPMAALTALAADQPLRDQVDGSIMVYSSGTTGRPKGIKRPLTGMAFGDLSAFDRLMSARYGFSESTRYLCPAPLYHAAPLGWSMGTQRLGGTVVLMDRFDAIEALRAIEQHRVTHAQFVPTMFIRMLKLPEDVRRSFDLSTLTTVIHAAAPCPVEVKHQMIEWFGPIIEEYYAGSEGNGFCAVSSHEWLEHPGTVGRPMTGAVHIVDEAGNEVPSGETGLVYFGGGGSFEYFNDASKTNEAFEAHGWSTLGDIGRTDDDGYLYLTDRQSHMIISGGVNIYPQEIEDVLVLHPSVHDVGVIGVHDAEMGESVLAVVQPAEGVLADDALRDALIAYCRQHLAGFKCPRAVEFTDDLPRLPTGKLFKRRLRDIYAIDRH